MPETRSRARNSSRRTTRRVPRSILSANPPRPKEKIALCIPFHIGDMQYLKQCLISISRQIRQPDLVVISFSLFQEADQQRAMAILSPFQQVYPIEVLFSTQRQNASKNRNLAAAAAIQKGATILSFLDCDDIAHPRRLELLERAFERYPHLDGIVHNYIGCPMVPNTLQTTMEWKPLTGRIEQNCFSAFLPEEGRGMLQCSIDIPIANGHVTVRSAMWSSIRYREESSFELGEDNHFNASCIKAGAKFAFLTDPLSAYLH
jgi:hypothetical protein